MLGIIPRGTANALCAALHIPTDVRCAAQMIATGSLRRLDFPRVCYAGPGSYREGGGDSDGDSDGDGDGDFDDEGYGTGDVDCDDDDSKPPNSLHDVIEDSNGLDDECGAAHETKEMPAENEDWEKRGVGNSCKENKAGEEEPRSQLAEGTHLLQEPPSKLLSSHTATPTTAVSPVPAPPARFHLAGPHSMLLLCGIGLEAETVRAAHRRLKRAVGAAAYALAGLGTIWRQPRFSTTLTLYGVHDDLMFANGTATCDSLTLSGLQVRGVTIANAAPAASVLAQGIGAVRPDDGYLEVVCINSEHPLGMIHTMLSMLASALLRRRERRGNVYGLRAKKVRVECEPPQRIVIDGEEAGVTPICIELRDGGARGIGGDCVDVIAPKAGTVNRRKRRFSRSLVRLWRNARGLALLALGVTLLRRRRCR